MFEALIRPDLDPSPPWLAVLLPDEQLPRVVEAVPDRLVAWSSLRAVRPDALVRFDLDGDDPSGTGLRCTLLVEEPEPPDLGGARLQAPEGPGRRRAPPHVRVRAGRR